MSTYHETGPAVAMSENYRRLNAELHQLDPSYGTTGRKYVSTVRSLAGKYKAKTILDYGCGKQDLSKALANEFDVRSFDPALPAFDTSPDPADLVACIDVLEHVEPEYLEDVLADLARVTIKAAFLTIATRCAGKHLSDGTNCHRIVQNPSWWLARLRAGFCVVQRNAQDENGLQVVVEPLCFQRNCP